MLEHKCAEALIIDNRLDNDIISSAIDDLTNSLGIKEDVDNTKFRNLLRANETRKCIKAIASQLELPVDINLTLVPRGYSPGGSHFQSQGLSRTDSRGRGIDAITAQVSIPHHLPLYGTPELTHFPINVKVSENCSEQPDTFMAVMAHELSHVLLNSLLHPHKDKEFYVDLTAMVLGFSSIIEKGRKIMNVRDNLLWTRTQTTTYGYLSDAQFYLALRKIRGILVKYRQVKKKLQDEIKALKHECTDSKKTLLRFCKFLQYMDAHPNISIKQLDTPKIIFFHQTGYTDQMEGKIRESERFLTNFMDFNERLRHYTKQTLDTIQQHRERVRSLYSTLRSKRTILNNDVKVMRKYANFWFRVKTTMEVRQI